MRFCSNCGEPIDENAKYCKECGHKHKKEKNIILYFILMILLVIVFDVVSSFILTVSDNVIVSSRFGLDLILESIWALTVFIVLVLAGNTYIFRRKRMPLLKSIGLAVPMIVLTFIYFLNYIVSAIEYSPADVLCVGLMCFAVGVMEEFLCRGWVLTEFLERYGYDRKHVHYAIILSALIFGGMHITNILAGQSVLITILQMIQTIGSGYLLGCLFYRTRNIWSCVITHAVYDFSIYLSEITIYEACTSGTTTYGALLGSAISSILLAIIYAATGEIIIRKSKTNELLPHPEKLEEKDIVKSNQLKKTLLVLIIICVFATFIMPKGSSEMTCTTYTRKALPDNYYVTVPNVKKYEIIYADYNFEITKKDDKYLITNINTGYSVELDEKVDDIIAFNNSSYFSICEVVKDDADSYELKYIQVDYSKITDDNEFLDNLFKNAKEYIVPVVSTIGTISYEKGGEEYFYFESDQIKYGMIDSDSELYELIEK